MTIQKAKGNMYDWVTHVHTHLAGRCSHECKYCFVQAMAQRFPAMREKYSGPVRLIEKELEVDYGSGKTIFIDHLNDLFAGGVPYDIILRVLDHCRKYPDNTYVFQTKNPARYWFLDSQIPDYSILGTTIESDIVYEGISKAPMPEERANDIALMRYFTTFITIEPILEFNLDKFADMIIGAFPSFVNIGADSKGHGLPEPSYEKVMQLHKRLTDAGIEVRSKRNLDRLKGIQQ